MSGDADHVIFFEHEAVSIDVDLALTENTTGSHNIALGIGAGLSLPTEDNNIDIGNAGGGGEANTIRIGNNQTGAFIAGISGVPVTGTAVVVNIFGQLGVAPSSQRFKENIKPMDRASEAFLRLKAVVFRYKKEIDALKEEQEELKEQRYLIQKVSDKIDVGQSTTKVARREP